MSHVLFDLNGTLTDAGAITAAWPEGRAAGPAVLDDAVMQAMVDTMTGSFRPFPEYVRAVLVRRAAIAGLGEDLVEAGVQAAKELPAHEDAAVAIARLTRAGHTPSVLTNSGARAARETLAAAGLLGELHAVLGADAVRAYKPDARVYRHALDTLRTPAQDTWLVAAHWWDVWGAQRAGLRTAWISRDDRELPGTVPEPDVRATTLLDAAEQLAALR